MPRRSPDTVDRRGKMINVSGTRRSRKKPKRI